MYRRSCPATETSRSALPFSWPPPNADISPGSGRLQAGAHARHLRVLAAGRHTYGAVRLDGDEEEMKVCLVLACVRRSGLERTDGRRRAVRGAQRHQRAWGSERPTTRRDFGRGAV